VKDKASVLQFASPELWKDRGLILVAVMSSPLASEYASPELRKDRKLVLLALKNNGSALEFVDPKLQRDKQILYAAVQKDPGLLESGSWGIRICQLQSQKFSNLSRSCGH
jgi:hypothetical protein